jgi:hypothetical protein
MLRLLRMEKILKILFGKNIFKLSILKTIKNKINIFVNEIRKEIYRVFSNVAVALVLFLVAGLLVFAAFLMAFFILAIFLIEIGLTPIIAYSINLAGLLLLAIILLAIGASKLKKIKPNTDQIKKEVLKNDKKSEPK